MPVDLQAVRREIFTALQPYRRLLPPSASEGDVDGPSSATDDQLVAFDGTTGKLIKGVDMRVDDDLISDETVLRPINYINLHIMGGIGGGGAGPAQDMIISGGDATMFAPADQGGDLYMRGGYSDSALNQGDVYIEGYNIWLDGLVQQGPSWQVQADFESGVGTDTVSSLTTGSPVSFPDGILLGIDSWLYLDDDMDTGLVGLADDLPAFYAGGNIIWSTTDAVMTMSVPLSLLGQELWLGIGVDTGVHAPSADVLDWTFGGVVSFAFELDEIHGRGGVPPRDFTIRAGGNSSIGSGDGGDLIFQSGDHGLGGGAQGALRMQDADGNDIMRVDDGGIHGNIFQAGAAFDGGGAAIQAGQEFTLRIHNGFKVTAWYIMADQSGSIVIDVWKDTFANYPPTVGDTMVGGGGTKPTLSAQDHMSGNLSGWAEDEITPGDVLTFRVDSATTIERCTIILVGTNSGSDGIQI